MSSYMKAGYTPPKAPKPPKKKKAPKNQAQKEAMYAQPTVRGTKRPKEKPPAKPKKPLGVRVLIALCSVLGVATLCTLAFVLVAFSQLNAYEDQFFPGVYVDGVHLGGLTAEQAATTLQARMTERLEGYAIALKDDQGEVLETLHAQDVSLHYDLNQQLTQAFAVGRTGNLIERMMQVREVGETPFLVDAVFVFDADALDAFVAQLAGQIDCEPGDAEATFLPQSAAPFGFTDEMQGALLDQEALRETITAQLGVLDAKSIALPIQVLEPTVRRAELEENISLRALTKSDIESQDVESRGVNIDAAIVRINGLVLEPGEQFDFNAVVGRRTTENGFVQAPEIAYGEGISGVGGGVCQVSTALYQAALCAGLEIIEHHPHVYPAAYAPAGQDATVSDQGLNLVFANDTGTPLYVKARVLREADTPVQIEITFFGAQTDALYALESQVDQVLPIPEAVRVRDGDQTYVTYLDEEQQVSDGREGLVASTYRITLQNGEETSRTLIGTQTYSALAPQIYVGTISRTAQGEQG